MVMWCDLIWSYICVFYLKRRWKYFLHFQLMMRIVKSNVRKLFNEIMQVYLSYVSVTVLCEHWHTGTQTASLRAATLVSGDLVAPLNLASQSRGPQTTNPPLECIIPL